MPALARSAGLASRARWAGILYLIIILAGLGAEVGLRAQFVHPGDAGATAEAILAAPGLFRLALAADLVMALCDAGLAILLYLIFCEVSAALALAAMVFRLIQTVVIAVNLMAMQAAWLVLRDGAPGSEALAAVFVELHAHGYDLGLVFFGINGLLMALLVWRSGLFARALGVGLAAAGGIYLIGSGLRFFAPEMMAVFAPAYGICVLAEAAFCIRLLAQRSGA